MDEQSKGSSKMLKYLIMFLVVTAIFLLATAISDSFISGWLGGVFALFINNAIMDMDND